MFTKYPLHFAQCFFLNPAERKIKYASKKKITIPTNNATYPNKLHSFLFYRKFRLCITKTQGKAHTHTVARPKALPLGELPTESGERVIVAIVPPLRRLRRHLSPRARLFVSSIITQIGRGNNHSAEIFVFENPPLRTTELNTS